MDRCTFDALAAAGCWRDDVTFERVQAVAQLMPKRLPAVFWLALFFAHVAVLGLCSAVGELLPDAWHGGYALLIVTLWLGGATCGTACLEARGYLPVPSAQWVYALIGACTSAWGLAVGVTGGSAMLVECALLPPTLWAAALLCHGRTVASGTFALCVTVAWVQDLLLRLDTSCDAFFYSNLVVASAIYAFGCVSELREGPPLVPWQSFLGPAAALYLGLVGIGFEIRIDFKFHRPEPAFWLDWLLVAGLAFAPITYWAHRTGSQVACLLSFGMTWVAIGLATNYLSGPLGRLLGWLINLSMAVLGVGLAMWVRQRRVPVGEEDDDEALPISMHPKWVESQDGFASVGHSMGRATD